MGMRDRQLAEHHRTVADPRRWKALALLAVVNFMVILDSQIVILALPSIDTELRFADGGAQWVMSAYLLGFGGLLLLGGRLGTSRRSPRGCARGSRPAWRSPRSRW